MFERDAQHISCLDKSLQLAFSRMLFELGPSASLSCFIHSQWCWWHQAIFKVTEMFEENNESMVLNVSPLSISSSGSSDSVHIHRSWLLLVLLMIYARLLLLHYNVCAQAPTNPLLGIKSRYMYFWIIMYVQMKLFYFHPVLCGTIASVLSVCGVSLLYVYENEMSIFLSVSLSVEV